MLKLTIYCDVLGCDNQIEVFADEIDMNGSLHGIEDIEATGWEFFDSAYIDCADGVYCHECQSRVKKSGEALEYYERWKGGKNGQVKRK